VSVIVCTSLLLSFFSYLINKTNISLRKYAQIVEGKSDCEKQFSFLLYGYTHWLSLLRERVIWLGTRAKTIRTLFSTTEVDRPHLRRIPQADICQLHSIASGQ